jgi:hypothetical protein
MLTIFTKEMIKRYEFDFGSIQIFTEYIIFEANEETNVDHKHFEELEKIASIHFKHLPFGLIGNRKNRNSINPAIYLRINEIPNLVAIAIVSYSSITDFSLTIEKNLVKNIPFKVFGNLEDAVDWIKFES